MLLRIEALLLEPMIEYGGLFVVGGRLETISHNSPGRRGTTSKMKNPRTFCRADTSRVDESLPMTLVHSRRFSTSLLDDHQIDDSDRENDATIY